MLRLVTRAHSYELSLRSPSLTKAAYISSITKDFIRKMSTALAPVASTSQPASNPALQKAGGAKKPKDKKIAADESQYPLEVHQHFLLEFDSDMTFS